MAREDFIPVALDDWYQRRRQDAEGAFFKKVYSQDASRAAPDRPNRQGIYCLTATGQLLGVKNAGQLVDVTRELMRQSLSKWEALPEEERAAGAVKVPPMKYPDERFVPAKPPPGTLILDIFTRVFDFDAQGELQKGRATVAGSDWAAREKMWIFEPEWKAIVPAGAKPGDSVPLPPSLVHRLVSYHLRDNTTGISVRWERAQIRSREMRLTVDEVGAATVKLRLDGSATMATDADPTKAQRGMEMELLGFLTYDLAKKAFTRFDVIALGKTRGRSTDSGDERTVARPIGFAMQLSSGSPYDVIAPDSMKLRQAYVNGE